MLRVARAFILNEKGELLVLRRREDVSWGSIYYVPGGKVEAGETPEEAAQREVLEETGLTIALGDLFFEGPRDIKGKDWYMFDYIATVVSGSPANREPDMHDWIGWVKLEECFALEPQIRHAFSEPIQTIIDNR